MISRRLGVRGIAAVEFAICAPMLLILFIGTIEILMLYRTEAKLNEFAGNLARMVSLQENAAPNSLGIIPAHSPVPTATSGTTPGLTDLCAGAVYGLQPFPPNGLTIAVASVTESAAAPLLHDEWEVDMNSACATTGAQAIGSIAAVALANGSGGTASMLQGLGDNIIIVKASLQYPGLIGLIVTSAQTLNQTAIARWVYAATTNVTNAGVTPAPSATLEFSCSGSGCTSNYGV